MVTFRELCKQGRLFEVQEWLEAGRAIEFKVSRRQMPTPLEIAVSKGFHSLVEILLKHGFPPDSDSLHEATYKKRIDLLKLLFAHGADPNSIYFDTVLDTANREIIDMFIEAGADTNSGYPLAEAFLRAPKFFCGVYKAYVDKFPEWRKQANVALRRATSEAKIRSICLLLWLGADPRVKVPERLDDDEECWETAIETAVWRGNLEVIKLFKLNSKDDDLDHHLQRACMHGSLETIEYLVDLGGDLNAPGPEEETAGRNLIWSFAFAIDMGRHGFYSSRRDDADRCLDWGIERGAKWTNPSQYDLRQLRRSFGELEPSVVLNWVRKFVKNDFCDEDTLIRLLKTAKMRKHLAGYERQLAKIIPWFVRWVPSSLRTGRNRS